MPTISNASQTRPEQLAYAMLAIAKVDHYMVGLVETVTWEEASAAEQILIEAQNTLLNVGGHEHKRYNLAIDLIEQVICDTLKA